MRRVRQPGEWIAGFTSEQLIELGVGKERLVYLMRIGEKLTFEQYFHDKHFVDKQPDFGFNDQQRSVGDRIYEPLKAGAVEIGDFRLIPNPYHSAEHMAIDLPGHFVLVSDEFYYFGTNAIRVPDSLRPKVPIGPARYGIESSPDRAAKFIDYIRSKYSQGLQALPIIWSDDGGCKSCGEGSRAKTAAVCSPVKNG